MKTIVKAILLSFLSTQVLADDLLIKVAQPVSTKHATNYFQSQGLQTEALTDTWIHVKGDTQKTAMLQGFLESGSVVKVQKKL